MAPGATRRPNTACWMLTACVFLLAASRCEASRPSFLMGPQLDVDLFQLSAFSRAAARQLLVSQGFSCLVAEEAYQQL